MDNVSNEALSRFMSSQARARKLIQMDANGSLDGVVNEAKKNGTLSYDTEGNVNTTLMEKRNEQQPSYSDMSMIATNNTKSRLPREIIESFAKNNIDTSGFDVDGGSILDTINNMSSGKLYENIEKPKKQQIKENVIAQPSNIDYSMIRMIVEDCMKKYASSLKKTILNENKNVDTSSELKAMKIGEKFSFIAKNGDIYEAKLKKIGNVKNL